MAFDPDAYIAEKSGFDPDAYLAGKSVPRETEQPEQPEQPTQGMLDSLRQAILDAPGGSELAEFGAAINRGTASLADFFTTKPFRSVQQIAGVPTEDRIPTIEQTFEEDTRGNFVEPGLKRDILRAAGETIPAAMTGGALLRSTASAIPKVQLGGETIKQGITKQLGTSTARQDALLGGLSGTGGEIGEEFGGEPGKLAGSILLPMAPQAIKSVTGNAIKRIFRGSDKNLPGINKTIDDFATVGDSPTVAQATGSRPLQATENIGGRISGGGRIIKKADQLSKNIQTRITQIADDVSRVEGSEQAGLAIKRGITGKNGFVDRFTAKSSQLWNKSDSFIPAESNASITNTKSTLDRLVRGGDVGKILDNTQLSRVKAVLDNADTVPYQVLKDLRSSIGQKLGNNELISDIPRAELKQLYGALSEDIRAIATAQGDDAIKAFTRANNFTRSGHQRLGDFVGRITKKVEVDKIFDAVTKGGEGTKLINTFKRSLKPDEWDVVASNVIRKLGRSTAGQQNAAGDNFSTDKFLTDWNKLGTAKNALLSGSKKLNSYKADLDKIARVAEISKESAKTASNLSGSGQSASNFALATAGTSGVITGNVPIVVSVAGTVTMNNMGARLMTNKPFVKWLASNSTHVGKLTAAQLSALVSIGKDSNLDDAMAIQSLVEELEGANDG